ncbi:MAG: hypothetical protein ABI775_00540, partial [Pseudonocardiales bacterium]
DVAGQAEAAAGLAADDELAPDDGLVDLVFEEEPDDDDRSDEFDLSAGFDAPDGASLGPLDLASDFDWSDFADVSASGAECFFPAASRLSLR